MDKLSVQARLANLQSQSNQEFLLVLFLRDLSWRDLLANVLRASVNLIGVQGIGILCVRVTDFHQQSFHRLFILSLAKVYTCGLDVRPFVPRGVRCKEGVVLGLVRRGS